MVFPAKFYLGASLAFPYLDYILAKDVSNTTGYTHTLLKEYLKRAEEAGNGLIIRKTGRDVHR